MKTRPLNPSLGLVVYQAPGENADAMCFVGDIGQDLYAQAIDYLRTEEIAPEALIVAYWHNVIDDQYGNRYEAKIEQG